MYWSNGPMGLVTRWPITSTDYCLTSLEYIQDPVVACSEKNLSLLLTRKVVHHRSTNKRHPAAVISMLTNSLLRKDRGLPSLACPQLTCVLQRLHGRHARHPWWQSDPTVVSRSLPPQPSAAALGKSQRQQLSWEGKD